MLVLAIDPGSETSAFVVFDHAGQLARFGKHANADMLRHVREWSAGLGDGSHLVVEMIASYGMPVGREVFETCLWIGRFVEAWSGGDDDEHRRAHTLMYRRYVKLHLCGQARAKDTNVRQALLDRYGPGRQRAVGTKKHPGPLYGVTSDVWAALAVAVTFADGAGRGAA